MLQCIQHIVKINFGIETRVPNNVNRNEQEIVVSPNIAEHSVTTETPPTDKQMDGDIILDRH